MVSISRRSMATIGTLSLIVGWVSPVLANLTTVSAPHTGEASQASILSHVYGGSFAPATQGAASYTNGTITATRVDDRLPGGGPGNNLGLVDGVPGLPTTDQLWHDGIAFTSAVAKFAAFSQEFGYDDGGGYVKLFDVAVTGPTGYDVDGDASHHFADGVPWDWARSGQGGTYYSSNARNGDGLDHMITYQITGASRNPFETVWLLLWEDLRGPLGGSGHSDRDFNDLAVEVRATVVPVPGAMLLGVMGLGLVRVVRRRITG